MQLVRDLGSGSVRLHLSPSATVNSNAIRKTSIFVGHYHMVIIAWLPGCLVSSLLSQAQLSCPYVDAAESVRSQTFVRMVFVWRKQH